MKKIIFSLFVIFPLFISCQNHWQTVAYNEVSVQIPSDWGSKNTVNYFEETDITEYLISCWSKEKSSYSFAIQWIDVVLESDLYIESWIEIQKERFPIYKQVQFDEIVNVDFLGFEAKKCHFHGNLLEDVNFEGEYIAFTNNEYSYLVLIGGDKNFYNSNDYKHILNSIKANFSGIEQPKENKIQTTEIDSNFTCYEFRDYSLSVPNTMELRNENSYMSLGKEILKDKLQTIKKIDIGDCDFVFQPAGTDDVQNSERQKKALALYARVLISYQKMETDDFPRWNDDITHTQAEYNDLNKEFKDNLLTDFNTAKQMNMELLSLSDIKIAKNANKFVYIKQQYVRKGLKGNVKVVDYYLFNNNETVKLTISYRVSENNLWEADFNKIIDTFCFNTKK